MVESGIAAGKTAMEIAESSASFIEKIWQKINIGDPIATTVTYIYPRAQMKTTRIYHIPAGRRSIFKTKINLPVGRNFLIGSVFDLDSGIDYSHLSVDNTPGCVVFDPSKLPESCQRIMITTVNDVQKAFLNSLIDVRVSEVASRETEDLEKHWVVAAIKDEDLFKPFYRHATLEDVDVGVGINVDRQYSTVLKDNGNPLIELIRANKNIFKGIDENKRSLETVAVAQRRRLLKEMKHNKENIFSELTRLCLPDMFRNYISTDNPNLIFTDAKRSENLMTFANMVIPIPSQMRVTVFTTLKLDDSAQRGYVTFNRTNFCEDATKIIKTHFK